MPDGHDRPVPLHGVTVENGQNIRLGHTAGHTHGVWCQLVRMVLAGGVGVRALAAATHGPPPVPLGVASAAAVIAEVDARSRNLAASNPSINGMVRTPQPAAGDRSRVERMSLRKHPPTRHALRLIRDPHLASPKSTASLDTRTFESVWPQRSIRRRAGGPLRSWRPTPCWGWRGLPTAGSRPRGAARIQNWPS